MLVLAALPASSKPKTGIFRYVKERGGKKKYLLLSDPCVQEYKHAPRIFVTCCSSARRRVATSATATLVGAQSSTEVRGASCMSIWTIVVVLPVPASNKMYDVGKYDQRNLKGLE